MHWLFFSSITAALICRRSFFEDVKKRLQDKELLLMQGTIGCIELYGVALKVTLFHRGLPQIRPAAPVFFDIFPIIINQQFIYNRSVKDDTEKACIMNRNPNTDSGGIRMKKCISIYLALILILTVIVVPSTAETTIKIGELTYLNSDGTSRSGMLAEALNAIQSYSGGFQIFGNTYVLNDEGAATPVEIDHVEAVEFDSLNSMVMSLNAGTIDGMIVYFTVGSYLCRQNENLTSWLDYSEMEKIYGGEMTNIKNRFILDQILGTDFSFLMMEDHAALRDEFNQAIADLKADGTLDALRASIMDLNRVELEEIDNAETIRVGVTGDLPPIDYVDEEGIPAGFNTAVLAEISKRIGKNIELVSIDSGVRSLALSEGIVDVVFWSRISAPDQSIYDSLPEKRKTDATMIGLALAPYRHPDIDIPEGTITTDVYFHDIYITLYMKK